MSEEMMILKSHLRRKLLGAALLSLAIVGSLYAINRSRKVRKPVDNVENRQLCDSRSASAHAIHTIESFSATDSDPAANQPPLINKMSAPSSAPEGMIWIPGGEFSMGAEDPDMSDARPFHRVAVDGYWMDQTEVTNEEFGRFVKASFNTLKKTIRLL